MTSLQISGVVVASLLGGQCVGYFVRQILPEHHLIAESKDAVKLGIGLISTMAALVLGLLVGTAKGSFDTQKSELTQMSAKVILLDRALSHYGDEAKEIRQQLKQAAERMIDLLWSDRNSDAAGAQFNSGEKLYESILALSPKNDAQKTIQSQALGMAVDIGQTRWLLYQQADSSVPAIFLVVLIVWLSLIFASFGLFAPVNLTVIGTLTLCAFSVAGAIFLIMELDRPFTGAIEIPKATLRSAIEILGR
jgi:hypothetical protein